MTDPINQLWTLARRPTGELPVAEDFSWSEITKPDVGPDQMLTRTLYLSMDPYQWVRRRTGTEKPGEVCHGRTVSQVIESRLSGYEPGDYVFNTNGWQSYGLTGEGISNFGYMHPRKLDERAAPLSTAIGVLGMLGLTAYSGLIVQCQPHAGDTVVVSAASGGVGQVVGQLARLRGAHVVGIAGNEEKCRYVVDELRFDACLSHRSESLGDDLKSACPDGVDVYFENVGGAVFDAVLPLLSKNARISLCGLISQYDRYGQNDQNPREQWQAHGDAVFSRQNVEVHDLFVGNFVDEHQQSFLEEMSSYVAAGEVRYKEHFYNGLAAAPEAFADMLAGRNFGKTIVTVAQP